jgi:hypothetical protein
MHGHLYETFAPKRKASRQRTGPAPEAVRGIAQTPTALAAGEGASGAVVTKGTALVSELPPPARLPEQPGGGAPPSERETSPELPAVDVGTETIPPRPRDENTTPEIPCVSDRKPPEN